MVQLRECFGCGVTFKPVKSRTVVTDCPHVNKLRLSDSRWCLKCEPRARCDVYGCAICYPGLFKHRVSLMSTPAFAPVHPGEIFREDVIPDLAKREIGMKYIAFVLGVSVVTAHHLRRCRTSVTPDTALGLSELCGNSAEFWMHLQVAYDLWHARKRRADGQKNRWDTARREETRRAHGYSADGRPPKKGQGARKGWGRRREAESTFRPSRPGEMTRDGRQHRGSPDTH
jgi:addiction module HigA family antidote